MLVSTLTLALGLGAFHRGEAQSTPQLTWGAGGAGGAGTWSTDTTNVDWYNGTGNVPWTDGDTARFGGTAGTVSISGSVTTPQVTFATAGYTLSNFFLTGSSSGLTVETDADATISASIFGSYSGTGYNTPFTKTGGGVLTLTGSEPVFFGSVNVASGELRYSAAVQSTTPYVLANVSGVALTFAATSNLVDSLGGGGVNSLVRPNVTSGSVGLTLNGGTSASFGGTIQDNGSATFALQKNGTSTQALTGANTYSGATTVNAGTLALAGANGALTNTASLTVNTGGTVLLDNSGTVNTARLANGLAVNLSGGTLSMTGNATANSKALVGAVSFSRAANVSVTQPGTAAAPLTLTSLTRQNNGTINFSGGGNVVLGGVNNLNGIVGGYATVGADWATVDASNRVFAYSGYVTNLGSPTDQNNVQLTSAGGTTTALGQSQIHNSLNLVNTGSSAAVLDLGAGQKLDLSSGGLLTSGGAGHVIQNGTLTSSGGELIVNNLAALTVSSTVADNGRALALTKSGAGTLALTGTNTYTGATTIDQGTVQAAADANLGAGSTVILSNGTLQATGSFTSAKSLQGSGGTVDTGSNSVAFNGGSNTGALTKIGSGMLSLTGTVGTVNVNAGVLRLTSLTGNSAVVSLLGGRLEATGGVQQVLTLGNAQEISPGAIGQAATLTLSSLVVFGSGSVVDFDLGSSAKDTLTINGLPFLGSSQLLFRFNNLGGIQTGTAYTLLSLPSAAGSGLNAGEFGIDAASTAAGYKGTFTVTSSAVSVTFSAVPEPGASVFLAAAVGLWGVRAIVGRRHARGQVKVG